MNIKKTLIGTLATLLLLGSAAVMSATDVSDGLPSGGIVVEGQKGAEPAAVNGFLGPDYHFWNNGGVKFFLGKPLDDDLELAVAAYAYVYDDLQVGLKPLIGTDQLYHTVIFNGYGIVFTIGKVIFPGEKTPRLTNMQFLFEL